MMIVALDLAALSGVAVGSSGSDPRCWSVNLGKGMPVEHRLSQCLRLTHGVITKHKPDLVVIERPAAGQFTDQSLVGLVACAQGCACNMGIPSKVVAPQSVRKHFLGKAYTSRDFPTLKRAQAKREIKKLVMKRCEILGWEAEDDNAADAAALWDYAQANFNTNYQPKPLGELFNAKS